MAQRLAQLARFAQRQRAYRQRVAQAPAHVAQRHGVLVHGQLLALGDLQFAWHPHLARGVPLQRAMADVVGRIEAAHARGAALGHATGMAAVQQHAEIHVVRQLHVALEQPVVGERGVLGPVEVVRHQRLVHAVHPVAQPVGGQLRAVAAVVQDALVAGTHSVQQPVHALTDAIGGGPFVQHHADVAGVEALFLQHGAHQEHVVDAAGQPLVRIGIVVDADQQRALARRGHARGHGALFAQRTGDARGLVVEHVVPERADGLRMAQVFLRRVVGIAGNVEVRVHLTEVVGGDRDARGEHRVEAVVQVVPEARLLDGAEAAGLVLAAHERIADLRAQRDEVAPTGGGARFLVGEGVVADQRAQAVAEHDMRLHRLDALDQAIARLLAEGGAFDPLHHHARGMPQARIVAARTPERSGDAVGQQARQGFQRVAQPDFVLGEDVVVVAVLDVERAFGIDLPARLVDRGLPGLLPRPAGRMLAHAVYAEDP